MVRFSDSRGASNTGVSTGIQGAENAEKSKRDHLYSDVDLDAGSQHHTLGSSPTQAAPGSHGHSELSPLNHVHSFDDLPEIIIPDEVIVQPTDPVLDGPVDEGTLWVDTSLPDAKPQIVKVEWETDPFAVTSTTFAHPSKWGNPIFVAPCDGTLEIECFVKFDCTGLTNSRLARWRVRAYDSSGTFVTYSGNDVMDDRTRVFYLFNKAVCSVLEGETYRIVLEFSLSHANGTTFTVSDAQGFLKFLPYTEFDYILIETDP